MSVKELMKIAEEQGVEIETVEDIQVLTNWYLPKAECFEYLWRIQLLKVTKEISKIIMAKSSKLRRFSLFKRFTIIK